MSWRDRVFEERKELREKLIRLSYFIKGDEFEKMSNEQQQLLAMQEGSMMMYEEILTERLEGKNG